LRRWLEQFLGHSLRSAGAAGLQVNFELERIQYDRKDQDEQLRALVPERLKALLSERHHTIGIAHQISDERRHAATGAVQYMLDPTWSMVI